MSHLSMFEYRQAVAGRIPFAPGADYLLTSDGACICLDCAFKKRADMIRAIASHSGRGGWLPVSVCNTYNDEGFVECDVCNDTLRDDYDTDDTATD